MVEARSNPDLVDLHRVLSYPRQSISRSQMSLLSSPLSWSQPFASPKKACDLAGRLHSTFTPSCGCNSYKGKTIKTIRQWVPTTRAPVKQNSVETQMMGKVNNLTSLRIDKCLNE